MSRTRQAAHKKSVPLARLFAAAALLLCVLSGALPAEAVFNPSGTMACCRAMKGMSKKGGNSCPLCHAKVKLRKPSKPLRREHMCGADLALRNKGRAAPASHALLIKAGLDVNVQAELENGDGVSTQDAPSSTSSQESAGVASLAKPCPSDCCGTAAGSLNGPRRPRHEAALTDDIRPRPPTAESYVYVSQGLIKSTSLLRRSCPPRAPPANLEDRAA